MSDRARDPWSLAALVLAVLTTGVLLPLCARSVLPATIDYNEGWNAFRQQDAWVPGRLYGEPPDLSVTNYPPLSFHLVGALTWFGADVVMAGRTLSLLAILSIGLTLARIAHRMTGSRALAACSMFGWLAGLELWTPQRVGTDDPQLLGMACEMLGLAIFASGNWRLRHILICVLLIVGGVFIKHNLLALPVGMTLTLLVRRAWGSLKVWLGAGLLVSGTLTGVTFLVDGPMFLQHLFAPRSFWAEQAVQRCLSFVVISLPSLVVSGLWAWRARRSAAATPLIFAWLASIAEIVAFAGGDGVGESIVQDAIMLTALVHPLALHDLLTRARLARAWQPVTPALPFLLMLSPLLAALQSGVAWTQLTTSARQASSFRHAISLIRDAPGPVACEDLLICFRAGRPSAFDFYYVLDQRELGRMPAMRTDGFIKDRRLAAVEIGTTDDPDTKLHASSRTLPSFMTALRENYKPLYRGPVFSIYVPEER